MSIASQLYKLQEEDNEIEAGERALTEINGELGNSRALDQARERLDTARKQLDGVAGQQRSVEWEIEDLNSKISVVEGKLYGGKITSPKELTDLQHESDILKANRGKYEEQALELMEQSESAAGIVSKLDKEMNSLEADWQSRQQKLAEDKKQTESSLATLRMKREQTASGIDARSLEIYSGLRKQRGTAVARVEQGVCLGCRISLPAHELQQIRTGKLVRCGTCGRILYLA